MLAASRYELWTVISLAAGSNECVLCEVAVRLKHMFTLEGRRVTPMPCARFPFLLPWDTSSYKLPAHWAIGFELHR